MNIYHIWGTQNMDASEEDFSLWECMTDEGYDDLADAMRILKQFVDVDEYAKLHYKYIIVQSSIVGYART